MRDMPDLNEVLRRIDQLPSLPAAVLQVTAMLSGGRAEVGAIERIARTDEALSVTILRYANSAQFGRPGRIFNLKESIVRLGGNALMRIVLQQKVSAIFERGGAAFGLGRGALWRSALGGAIAAQRLVEKRRLSEGDLCFLCALLRDIGKLALDGCFGRQYVSVVAEHMLPQRSFVEAERAALGFDHAQLGRELARQWGLPQRIAEAIGCHHEPPATGDRHDPLFDVVHAADAFAQWAGLSVGIDGTQYNIAAHVRESLLLDQDAAHEEIAEVWTRLRDVETMMNEPLQSGQKTA
jgi:HD-like signal output (HDOD) protein